MVNVKNSIIISIGRIIYRILRSTIFLGQRKGVSFSPCERKGYRINVGAKEQSIYGEACAFLANDTSGERKFAMHWLALHGFADKEQREEEKIVSTRWVLQGDRLSQP